MVAGVPGELLERRDVLREAAAAEAEPGLRKCGPRRWSSPTPVGDVDDVGADELADVGDLVDEADPRREKGVRCELDHLRGGDVRLHDRRIERRVQLGHPLCVRGSNAPITTRPGCMKSRDGRSLGEELGVRDVADAAQPAARRASGVPSRRYPAAPCSSSRASSTRHPAARRRPSRSRTGPRRPSRSEACRRRRTRTRRHRAPPPRRACSEAGLPRARSRRRARARGSGSAGAQPVDPLGDDVAHDDLVPEIGEHAPETSPTYPAPKTAIRVTGGAYLPPCAFFACCLGCFLGFSGCRPFAIAIIVSFESESSSVFTTQYVAPSLRRTIMWSFWPR